MSKLICSSAIDGAVEWVLKAEKILGEAISQKGEDFPVAFPDTNYYLPVIYSFTGKKMQNLKDLREILKEAGELLPVKPSDSLWLPYLGDTLDAGVAALFACEVIEACKYIIGPNPVEGIWLGAANDVIMRERGIEFVDGTAPGFAAITGAAPDNATAVKIAKELQQKNLYVFMGGSSVMPDGKPKQFAEQLAEEGVQLGWETRLIPFGKDVSSLIYALGFANRAAMSFGGVKPGDYEGNLKYNKNRVFAFVIALGEVTPDKYAAAAGAINYGFPVISDTDIPQILPTGICTYEHVVSNIPHENIVEKALEVRGCKIKIVDVPIPTAYGPAFEGERIRKEDTRVEFGGNRTTAFEFVTSVGVDEINDGEIEIIGPDIDTIEPGGRLPLGIWVEVAGRKMQSDFEPILERQIHSLVNGGEGIWHMGQRDIIWTRVSKAGFNKGLRLRHYGEILHAKLLADYPAIVDKVKVTLITNQSEVDKRIAIARKVYDERNRRLEAMTDESVDTFYSCLLCQSFAPNHVCVITPERLGLCGAYNWLDGKAAYEIDETGANQPLKKGECLDPVKGIWKGVNDYVYINSHKSIECFTAYSIMDRPMTSCGCFEVICAYLPECNGVMAVNREYLGETPIGMTFSTLAGSVGGGNQTPGFIGCGKVFLTSRKFLSAEGGFARLVWMPKELKEQLKADLEKRFGEQNLDDFYDKIADETIAKTGEEVGEYMRKVSHPALNMKDMSEYADADSGEKSLSADEDKTAVGRDAPGAPQTTPSDVPSATPPQRGITQVPADTNIDVEKLTEKITAEVTAKFAKEIMDAIVNTLGEKFNWKPAQPINISYETDKSGKIIEETLKAKTPVITAEERINAVKSFALPVEKSENKILNVTLGKKNKVAVGGADCMPFHLWEGKMPNRPLIAMEVFDSVSEKFPKVLSEIYGDVLNNPVEMAKLCVEKYKADLISVRLEGTHPEKGNKSVKESIELVGNILKSIDVPLIITGHSNFDKNNEVMKAVAQTFEGENLLFNWVEQDNYKTIAGAAMAYGHTLVAQSPIDVNISKQLNILLTNMGLAADKIIIDPMTSSIGYGIEYTYSVMERIRQTGLGGDKMLINPMLVSVGQECMKIKEVKASEKDFPNWGDLAKRAAYWEIASASSLLYAGADILILYHPEAVKTVRKTIFELMDNNIGEGK
ncbi:MAG: acetyl-CoA decarbonylase/synthase complex subunit alpha/beta [Oscillospiraceae bacterium]|nr:acetyl-CoA decarbonylase/synthase complex subunit alpha/beta [Oscillospiraceae bacterium]